MKKLIQAGVGGLALVLLFTSSSSHYEDPNGKAGVAGGPNEETCANSGCHDTYTLNSGTGSVTISSSNMTDWTYVPGTTYTISVTVAQANIQLFGLCFEALKPNGDNAGTLHAGTGTQIKNKTVGSFQRHSITHNTNTGASSNTHTFTFTWDAPATDIGDITFYVSGLAANGNGNESGDRVYNTSQVVSAATVGLYEIMTQDRGLTVFPNPATQSISFQTEHISSLVDGAQIIDAAGRTVYACHRSNWAISATTGNMNIEKLQPGTYTLCFTSGGRVISHASFQKMKP